MVEWFSTLPKGVPVIVDSVPEGFVATATGRLVPADPVPELRGRWWRIGSGLLRGSEPIVVADVHHGTDLPPSAIVVDEARHFTPAQRSAFLSALEIFRPRGMSPSTLSAVVRREYPRVENLSDPPIKAYLDPDVEEPPRTFKKGSFFPPATVAGTRYNRPQRKDRSNQLPKRGRK